MGQPFCSDGIKAAIQVTIPDRGLDGCTIEQVETHQRTYARFNNNRGQAGHLHWFVQQKVNAFNSTPLNHAAATPAQFVERFDKKVDLQLALAYVSQYGQSTYFVALGANKIDREWLLPDDRGKSDDQLQFEMLLKLLSELVGAWTGRIPQKPPEDSTPPLTPVSSSSSMNGNNTYITVPGFHSAKEEEQARHSSVNYWSYGRKCIVTHEANEAALKAEAQQRNSASHIEVEHSQATPIIPQRVLNSSRDVALPAQWEAMARLSPVERSTSSPLVWGLPHEVATNILAMHPAVAERWHSYEFYLEPLVPKEYADTTLYLQFFWSSPVEPDGCDDDARIEDDRFDRNAWPGPAPLPHNCTLIKLHTSDPKKYPLPDVDLLRMHASVARLLGALKSRTVLETLFAGPPPTVTEEQDPSEWSNDFEPDEQHLVDSERLYCLLKRSDMDDLHRVLVEAAVVKGILDVNDARKWAVAFDLHAEERKNSNSNPAVPAVPDSRSLYELRHELRLRARRANVRSHARQVAARADARRARIVERARLARGARAMRAHEELQGRDLVRELTAALRRPEQSSELARILLRQLTRRQEERQRDAAMQHLDVQIQTAVVPPLTAAQVEAQWFISGDATSFQNQLQEQSQGQPQAVEQPQAQPQEQPSAGPVQAQIVIPGNVPVQPHQLSPLPPPFSPNNGNDNNGCDN